MGLAMAYAHQEEDRAIGSEPLITYVTAQLTVNYLKPTPLTENGVELRASIEKTEGRKTWIQVSLLAEGVETARGEVLAVRIPEVPSES